MRQQDSLTGQEVRVAVLFDVALPLGGGAGVRFCLVGTQGLPLLGQAVLVPQVVLHVSLQGHHSLALARPPPSLPLPPSRPLSPSGSRPGPDQNHVSGGDVHVGLGRLLTPGRRAAVGAGAGLGCVAELRGHAAHPRGLWWTLRPVEQGLCSHVLAAQVLQRKGHVGSKGPLKPFLQGPGFNSGSLGSTLIDLNDTHLPWGRVFCPGPRPFGRCSAWVVPMTTSDISELKLRTPDCSTGNKRGTICSQFPSI